MIILHVLVLSIILTCSQGIDRTKLWRIPPPMKGFQLKPALGQWFVQFRAAPCSWEGSTEFQDYDFFTSAAGKNMIYITLTMRNGVCNTLTAPVFLTPRPGVGLVKDPVGNSFSGQLIYPATDYKSFSIIYVCTKMSVLGDKCDDSMLSVLTRMVKPDGKTITKINNALMEIFGVTVDQLQRVLHSKPCRGKQTPFIPKAIQWW